MFTRRLPDEPRDHEAFKRRFDAMYTRFAGVYAWAVKNLPVWKTWLCATLPHIEGERVLEVSFGTGYLMSHYAARYACVGLDYNRQMIDTARRDLNRHGGAVPLIQGDVDRLPFADAAFDCIVNTMAFSGYPDGNRALSEIRRVLRPGGRLVMLDIAYPKDNRRLGNALVNVWKWTGDVPRDMPALLERFGFEFTDQEVGGFGSVHLYMATKRA